MKTEMGLHQLMNNPNFGIVFSVLIGVGIICMIRPQCKGTECSVNKPPVEEDFDKYVYRMGKECYEFKPEIVECPASGAVEAFSRCSLPPNVRDTTNGIFTSRDSIIHSA